MRELAEGLYQIAVLPRHSVNAYLLGDVLVDAGLRQSSRRILKSLEGHDVRAHALTHAHPDHQGASHAICRTLGVPYWCGEGDVACAEDPEIETPGHSAGHLAFFRERDRALVLGDVLNNMNLLTTFPGLREPPPPFTPDPARNRDSARHLADLRPSLICFGHGPPLRDGDRFRRFVEGLPA